MSVGERCGNRGDSTSDPLRAFSRTNSREKTPDNAAWCGNTQGPGCPAPLPNRIERGYRETAGEVMGGTVGTMSTRRKTTSTPKESVHHELKKILEDRKRELMHDVQGRIRDARTDIGKGHQVLDEGETSEVDIQEDIEFALIQMKAETLNKIDVALRRLDEATYGLCFECGTEIAEQRLRALPFAVRCRDCEEVHETAGQRGRIQVHRSWISA
jgi:DnaK suppressor protein